MEEVRVDRERGYTGRAVVPGLRPAGDWRLQSFRMRNGSDEPTEFGYFVMRKMADLDPPLNQTELARRSGVGQATISRWIFKDGRPEADKLRQLAVTLEVDYHELLAIAGYGKPSEDVAEALADLRPDVDELALEMSAMLNVGSALTEDDRAFIRGMVDRIIDPYRKKMRRRRSA